MEHAHRRIRSSEVVVIGGGVVGCSIAYQLARRGVAVTVFERDDVCSGASGRNTGIVAARLHNEAVPGLPAWTARNRELLRELDGEWGGCFAYRERGGLHVPKHCPGVPDEVLQPRATWQDPEQYDRKARQLAAQFDRNFAKYADDVPAEVREAGPRTF